MAPKKASNNSTSLTSTKLSKKGSLLSPKSSLKTPRDTHTTLGLNENLIKTQNGNPIKTL